MDSCPCGRADECDGETAIFYPLQDGGMCAVRQCLKPKQPNYDKEYKYSYEKENPEAGV